MDHSEQQAEIPSCFGKLQEFMGNPSVTPRDFSRLLDDLTESPNVAYLVGTFITTAGPDIRMRIYEQMPASVGGGIRDALKDPRLSSFVVRQLERDPDAAVRYLQQMLSLAYPNLSTADVIWDEDDAPTQLNGYQKRQLRKQESREFIAGCMRAYTIGIACLLAAKMVYDITHNVQPAAVSRARQDSASENLLLRFSSFIDGNPKPYEALYRGRAHAAAAERDAAKHDQHLDAARRCFAYVLQAGATDRMLQEVAHMELRKIGGARDELATTRVSYGEQRYPEIEPLRHWFPSPVHVPKIP